MLPTNASPPVASSDAPPLGGGSPQVTDTAAPPANTGDVPQPSPPTAPPRANRPPSPDAGPCGMHALALAVVAGLAFLLASFPAHNTEIWVHLAAGRRLVAGDFVFAADPRALPNASVSPSWLYDLISYFLYHFAGGAGLALVNALLVAALAVVLWRLCRAGAGWWEPALCATLALLAMGIRLLLQPATVSCLLLALTLLLLRRRPLTPTPVPPGERGRGEGDRPPAYLPPWPLAALFVLWANLDGGFVFGLGVVAAAWWGEALDAAARKAAETRRAAEGVRLFAAWLPRVLAALIVLNAVCLLNPSHVYAFLPALDVLGLSWSSGSLLAPHGAAQLTSPFQWTYVLVALSPAGLAYYPLLALSLLSFLLTLPRWHWHRFLPWTGLALLSVLQVRTVPLFAVVAGPVLAWNLQEFFARRTQLRQRPYWRPGAAVLGRGLAALLGLVLLACAWTGWLQSAPYGPRAWAVETSTSLERGAAAVRMWHEHGPLEPDARGLHLLPESAQAFAWFCPEDKGLWDPALASAVFGQEDRRDDRAGRLRSAGINHVIVYDPDRRGLAALYRLTADPKQWPLLYEEGGLAVFGWRDPARPDADDTFRGMEVDLDRLAFRPEGDRKAPPGPGARAVEAPWWWEAFWKRVAPDAFDREEAGLRLDHATAAWQFGGARQRDIWFASQELALVGAAAGWSGPADLCDARVRLTMALTPPPPADLDLGQVPVPERWALRGQKAFASTQDDTPPALLYLAVRAARRAAAADPTDAKVYAMLGDAYLRLLHSTRERVWAVRLPELKQLRRAQASAALNRAVALKPDYAEARLHLFQLYQELGYWDLALDQLQTYLLLAHQAGPPAGADPQDFREQEAVYRQMADDLAAQLKESNDEYTLQSAGLRVQDRAALALGKHLAAKARDVLLESDVSAFGRDGMAMELELLLATGRAKDVADWTGPDQESVLQDPLSFHWFRARALAATGHYAQAQEEATAMAPSAGLGDVAPQKMTYRQEIALVVGRRVLEECPGAAPPYLLRWPFGGPEFDDQMARLAQGMKVEANVTVLWGLLALERGETDDAAFAFRQALGLWRDEATAASGGGLDFEGRPVAQAWMERLK
jgi:hypothetical protein